MSLESNADRPQRNPDEIFAKSSANSPDVSANRKSQKARNNYLLKIHTFNEGNPNDRWKVICELGGGSEAQVFKIRRKDEKNADECFAAAKIITLNEAGGDFADQRKMGSLVSRQVTSDVKEELISLMNEIIVLRQCRHDNIVRLLETYNVKDYIWLVEEYCQNGALDSVIAHAGKGLSEPAIAHVGRQLLLALEYLHSKVTVVHRDVKAGNIMVAASGNVKLADFGVAKLFNTKNAECHTFIGSAFWMAPEVIVCETNPQSTYSFPVDIWSFGITCIEMAEMNPPHHEMNQNRVLIRILKHGTPSLMDPSNWSEVFRDFLQKCLVVHRDQRLTANQLLDHEFLAQSTGGSEQFEQYVSESVKPSKVTQGRDYIGDVEFNCFSTSDILNGNSACNEPLASDPSIKAGTSKDEWAESDESDSDADDVKSHMMLRDGEEPGGQVLLKSVRVLNSRVDSFDQEPWETKGSIMDASDQRIEMHPIDSASNEGTPLDEPNEVKVNFACTDLGKAVPVETIPSINGADPRPRAIEPLRQIKIQTSPVDVYCDVNVSDLHSSVIRTITSGTSNSRPGSPSRPFVLASFDLRNNSERSVASRSSSNNSGADIISIERRSLCDTGEVAILLMECIVDSVLRDENHCPSLPDTIMSCLEEAGAARSQFNSRNVFQGQYLSISQQYTRMDASSSVSLRSVPVPCTVGSVQSTDMSDVSERIRRRREEGRDFRHTFQMQERRLRQIKSKQQAELRGKDQTASTKRQKTVDRLNGQEKDLINDQNHEIEKLKSTLATELKDEVKRKRAEMDRSIRRFADCQREELVQAKKNLLDPRSLHELEIRLFNRIEQFRQMQNQETDEYIGNVQMYHEEKLNLLKLSCLRKYQETQKDHFKIIFDLEERELCQKFQTICCHVKEFYSTMRSFMHTNQRKELEQLDESNKVDRETVLSDWNARRKNAIKYMREVCKTREKQYLQSISMHSNLSAEQAHREFKKFTESDHIRMQRECAHRDRAIEHKVNQLFVRHQQRKQQLLSVQAQRRAQCAEKEAMKLQEVQKSYALQLQSLRTEFEAKMNRVLDAAVPSQFSVSNGAIQSTSFAGGDSLASVLYTSEAQPWCCLADAKMTSGNITIASSSLNPCPYLPPERFRILNSQSECYGGDEERHYF